MKVIIQCAASKTRGAGCLQTQTGQRVKFVARPKEASPNDDWLYARPDDPSDLLGQTWRQQLVDYNGRRDNPLRLFEAFRLYKRDVYRALVDRFRIENVFILSAGWGLVRASYLLPDYDITFSQVRSCESYKRRRPSDQFMDWCHLSEEDEGPAYFLGVEKYLPLLTKLTDGLPLEKVVYYAGSSGPYLPARGWRTVRALDKSFTNWHYTCAREFMAERLPR